MNTSIFDYYVVLDFEATCAEGKAPKPQEIIEFPSVLLDGKTFETIDEFTSFVRPFHHPQLTEFCTDLTGVTQQQVDEAELFPEVLARHMAWLRSHNLKVTSGDDGSAFAFVTCGDWDLRRMFPNQCRVCDPQKKFIPHAYRQWINIKKHYLSFRGTKNMTGMAGMLRGLGLDLVGHHHSGIDDSHNIAQIVRHLGENGFSLTITRQSNQQCDNITQRLPE